MTRGAYLNAQPRRDLAQGLMDESYAFSRPPIWYVGGVAVDERARASGPREPTLLRIADRRA